MKEEFPKNEKLVNSKESLYKFDLSKYFEVEDKLNVKLHDINEYINDIITNNEYSDTDIPVNDLSKTKINNKLADLNSEIKIIGLSTEIVDLGTDNHEEIHLYISDGKLFLEYLKSIEITNITQSQKESLQNFLGGLMEQIYNAPNTNNQQTDHFLNALPYLEDIVKRSKELNLSVTNRIGQEFDLDDISESINPIKNGYLAEFSIYKRSYLYNKIIGPMWWHNNKNATEYREILESVLEDMKKIKENPKAEPLYEKMKSDFISTLQKLHKLIEDRPSEWEKINKNSELLPIIEEFQQKIEKLSGSG